MTFSLSNSVDLANVFWHAVMAAAWLVPPPEYTSPSSSCIASEDDDNPMTGVAVAANFTTENAPLLSPSIEGTNMALRVSTAKESSMAEENVFIAPKLEQQVSCSKRYSSWHWLGQL